MAQSQQWHRYRSTFDSTKPLPESMLTYQGCPMSIIWRHYHKIMKIPISKTRFKISFLKSHSYLPGANELLISCSYTFPYQSFPLITSSELKLMPNPNLSIHNQEQGRQRFNNSYSHDNVHKRTLCSTIYNWLRWRETLSYNCKENLDDLAQDCLNSCGQDYKVKSMLNPF